MIILPFKTTPHHRFANTERFDVSTHRPEQSKEVFLWHAASAESSPSSCGRAWYVGAEFVFSTITRGIVPCKFPKYWHYSEPYRTLEEDQANAQSVAAMAAYHDAGGRYYG